MTERRTIEVESALLGAGYEPSGPVRLVLAGGRITAIEPIEDRAEGIPRLLALPALTDAHNHARPLSTTSFGAGGMPLETWLPRLAVMPPVDPYLGAAASFARSVRGGCAAVMVHLTRPSGTTSLPEEAQEIARAASDVGVAIGFAVAMRDRNPLIYGDHAALLASLPERARQIVCETWLTEPMPVERQVALVDEVADAVAGLPGHIDVQYGPTGVQWCSPELLSAIADASARTGRRVHMHLLETEPQRSWADRAYPEGIVSMLERIGLLSGRLTLAHCVWARDEELEAVARSGARVVVNASSNLHLSSGVAPIARMKAAGVSIAMGLDGCALDEDDDALRELRLLRLLGAGWGFADGLTIRDALHAACAAGRPGLGLGPGGVLAPGMPADLLTLDLAALDRDAIMHVDPRALLVARARKEHLVEVVAHGRTILSEGRVRGMDLPAVHEELRSRCRAAMPDRAPLLAAWPALEVGIVRHHGGCC